MLRVVLVRVRWIRQKLVPWTAIAFALGQFLLSCGIHRTQAHIRLMAALPRLNVASLVANLNDLLF
jgi:hypothetical protein